MQIGGRGGNESGERFAIPRQGVEIAADAEETALGVDQHGAHRRIGGAFRRQFVELGGETAIERIAALALIERDMRDRFFDLERKRRQFHHHVPGEELRLIARNRGLRADQATDRDMFAQYLARNVIFETLPVPVSGKASTMSTLFGVL